MLGMDIVVPLISRFRSTSFLLLVFVLPARLASANKGWLCSFPNRTAISFHLYCFHTRHLFAGLSDAVQSRRAMHVATGWIAHAVSFARGNIMLYTIAVVLLILWVLGLVTSTAIGGFIHVLLVIAVVMVLLRLISGRGI
jgi:hypothetical protein